MDFHIKIYLLLNLRHAGVLCSTEELETIAVTNGLMSGDLCHPLPYCPEFFEMEFRSAVADMKNSVKSRSNAQASCAGHFIGSHIEEYLTNGGNWIHIGTKFI